MSDLLPVSMQDFLYSGESDLRAQQIEALTVSTYTAVRTACGHLFVIYNKMIKQEARKYCSGSSVQK